MEESRSRESAPSPAAPAAPAAAVAAAAATAASSAADVTDDSQGGEEFAACSPASLGSAMSSCSESRGGLFEPGYSLDKFMETLGGFSPEGQQLLRLDKRQVLYNVKQQKQKPQH